jgi:hypothetical protein
MVRRYGLLLKLLCAIATGILLQVASYVYSPLVRSGESVERRASSIGVVVSICQEPQETFLALKTLMRELDKCHGFTVRRYIYCKCGPWYVCDLTLPNVGREGNTFVTHVSKNYGTLDDIVWFVNGGFMSKEHATKAFSKIQRTLTHMQLQRHLTKLAYVDDMITSLDSVDVKRKPSYAQHSCLAIANAHCKRAFSCEYTLPCENKEACACEVQRTCHWTGATKENYNTTMASHLIVPPLDGTAPRGHSMYTWACSRLGVDAKILHQCGASQSGVFAVGSERLRSYPKLVYDSLVEEYEAYSTTGGLMGHYMERMYRSMFYCALENMHAARHRLHVFKVFTQHVKKLTVAFFKYH